jgi:Zn-dependent peptidase ImmA (M78 family)
MSNSVELARKAVRGAFDIRRRGKILPESPVCIYDLAERLNVSVCFQGGSSFGGMYSKSSNTILVPALRPPGRQAFTAAHELGHWYFQHGSRIDELRTSRQHSYMDPEEKIADLFAAHLLMPSRAIDGAFSRRNWSPGTCAPSELYLIACEFGVGYETLITHLRFALNKITDTRAKQLESITPKIIRQKLIGDIFKIDAKHIVLTDYQWASSTIDLQVGHLAFLPKSAVIEKNAVSIVAELPDGLLVRGEYPGISRTFLEGQEWAKFLRISRADFIGLNKYRHLEDPDVN